MIKVTVLYPNEEGKKFDHGYWTTTHLNLVQSLLGPMGLVNGEMEKASQVPTPTRPRRSWLSHIYISTLLKNSTRPSLPMLAQ